jgi:hypothetical protein
MLQVPGPTCVNCPCKWQCLCGQDLQTSSDNKGEEEEGENSWSNNGSGTFVQKAFVLGAFVPTNLKKTWQ